MFYRVGIFGNLECEQPVESVYSVAKIVHVFLVILEDVVEHVFVRFLVKDANCGRVTCK